MSTLAAPPRPQAGEQGSARLILDPDRGKGPTDGTWWPRTTSLQNELPALDLAVHQLTGSRIARIAYTQRLWQPAPRKQRTSLGMTKLGWFTHSAHPENIDLSLADYSHLVLTVIAPATDSVLANIPPFHHATAPTGLLTPDRGPVDRWEDEGGGGDLPTHTPTTSFKPVVGPAPVPPWTTR
jgi:hypothetical protein